MSRQQPTQARGESRVDRIHRQMLESVAAAAKARAKADDTYRQALADAAAEHVPFRDLGKAAGTTASNVFRIVKERSNA